MRTISSIILLLIFGAVSAHEKHISTISILDNAGTDAVTVLIKIHQPDYLACSKAGKEGFEQWIEKQIQITCGATVADMQMTDLVWGHDISATFTATIASGASTLLLHSVLFTACLPSQKTIVAAKLGGLDYGRILNAQTDTCAFPLRK